MPRGDRRGPEGFGPMTGRGMGYCAGNDTPGYMNGFKGFFRRGLGCGRGFGRGFGYGYYYEPPTKEETKEFLTEEMNYLKKQMEDIQKRLNELNDEE
jgi:hypothetical protein